MANFISKELRINLIPNLEANKANNGLSQRNKLIANITN